MIQMITSNLLEVLPSSRGSYVLQLHLAQPRSVVVGRLGVVRFPAGEYFYVGSAFGQGGLRSRLSRHFRQDAKRYHWHIDHLRAVASVCGCLFEVSDQPLECRWSQALASLPSAVIPVPRFGSTDCRSGCRSHLVSFPLHFDLAVLPRALTEVAGR
jgi:Uri superfamily endonuclease